MLLTQHITVHSIRIQPNSSIQPTCTLEPQDKQHHVDVHSPCHAQLYLACSLQTVMDLMTSCLLCQTTAGPAPPVFYNRSENGRNTLTVDWFKL